MRTLRTLSAAVAATALTAGLLAGCSSGDDTGTAAPKPTGAASFDPSTIAKDDSIAALLPASIASTGSLRIGSDTTYAPAEFIAADGKTAVGYDVDLAKGIAAILGVKADIQTASFDNIIPAIGSRYDLGISSFTITPERTAKVDFVSYFSAGVAFAVQKGNPKGIDPSDLCGKTVAVQTGTVEDTELDARSKACTDAGKAAINALKYPGQDQVTTNLVGGKADAMFADSPIVAYAITQTKGQLEQVGDILEAAPQGVAVKKGDTALATAVQKAVQKLIDSGDYAKILATWNATPGAVTTAEINPALG